MNRASWLPVGVQSYPVGSCVKPSVLTRACDDSVYVQPLLAGSMMNVLESTVIASDYCARHKDLSAHGYSRMLDERTGVCRLQ